MNKPVARISALSLSMLLFVGCATTSVAPTSSPAQQAAITLLEQGKPREAAQQLEAEAALTRGAQRMSLLADAAFAWNEAGDTARARMLLAQVQPRQLAAASHQRYRLLTAELALTDKQPAQALQALGDTPDQLPQSLQARWHMVHAQALEGTGDMFGAAGARARAGVLLSGTARTDNQRAITRLLAGMDDTGLRNRTAALPAGDPLYNYAGRALLARGLPLPRPFDRDGQSMVDTSKRPPAERDGYRPPAKLAVLLPLTGSLATAAAPVRDGLLAGYYAENRRRPEIEFIDTKGTVAGAGAAYEKAVASGADFVVGPLGREEVDAVFKREQLPVPVLALNRGKDAPPTGSAGFSLAPEDDGIMAAEYLLSRERRNAVVINSNDENGRRASAAFKERFSQRGGTVTATVAVSDNPADISNQLRQATGTDAVFLAVKGAQAKALAPQLALAGLGGASRVGTSQLALGTGKAEDDASLDGIAFPSEAWTARGINGLPPASTVASTLPTARGAAGRLFAFGFDAWRITAYLEKLASASDGGLQGATGTLHWMASAMCCALQHGPPSVAAGPSRLRMVAEHLQKGAAVELAAQHYLQRAGLQPLSANANYRGGELDLVMLDSTGREPSLVFVEVRYRRTAAFGGGAGSVDLRKRRRLIHAAQLFLAAHAQYATHACRFDVIDAHGEPPQLEWIRDAFRADDC